MSTKLSIQNITSGYRPIQNGKQFEQFFGIPDDRDKIIIKDGEVDDTVELMKKVVWKYIDDTKKIAAFLKGKNTGETCSNIWNFLYNHIQYKLDKKGLEQVRRPNRSWAERESGIDCDCFSVFVSSILTNLQIPHTFRITKYNMDSFQHVYVVVPGGKGEYIIDCVLSQFNYEKPYKEKKDFNMSLNGINVAVLSGLLPDVMDLVKDLEGTDNLGADNEKERLDAILAHLIKTRNMVAARPHLIQDIDYPPAFLKMLDYAIENWNTNNRDKALAILAQNEDALNKHFNMEGVPENSDLEGLDSDWDNLDGETDDILLGKLFKRKTKAEKAEKKAQKQEKKQEKKDAKQQKKQLRKNQPKKKGFFKKVGEAIKKGGKAFVRYNPVSISARNGFLLAMKLNIKKMASKLKWGYGTKEQAAAKGVNADTWQKSKNALTKVEVLFADKLQGKRDKLKAAILNGKAGGLSGTDDEYVIEGLGAVAAAAAIAAATPVLIATAKIISESGLFEKGEDQNIEEEINMRSAEAEEAFNDPELKDETQTDDGEDDDDSEENAFIGFIKRNPLIAAGGAGLTIWGISKLFGGNKKAPTKKKALDGTKSNTTPKSQAKARSRKAKIDAIRLS